MKNEKIEEVRIILEEWNPLGENSKKYKDLCGYKYEAMDIISNLRIYPDKRIEQVVKEVIEETFDITIVKSDLDSVRETFIKILKK